ncbi:hypothetical protein NOVOSPHI9U_10168 [Novosphingobium sp. 9U]|nr:hypothetical protein NOVOSPHI9U_10168 [Novosphingobium sp. 9U]
MVGVRQDGLDRSTSTVSSLTALATVGRAPVRLGPVHVEALERLRRGAHETPLEPRRDRDRDIAAGHVRMRA